MTTKPILTLSALEKIDGAADPEPFTLGLKSKIVTFPDPFALSVEESESLMADLEGTTSIKATLNRWLSEEDAEPHHQEPQRPQGPCTTRAGQEALRVVSG